MDQAPFNPICVPAPNAQPVLGNATPSLNVLPSPVDIAALYAQHGLYHSPANEHTGRSAHRRPGHQRGKSIPVVGNIEIPYCGNRLDARSLAVDTQFVDLLQHHLPQSDPVPKHHGGASGCPASAGPADRSKSRPGFCAIPVQWAKLSTRGRWPRPRGGHRPHHQHIGQRRGHRSPGPSVGWSIQGGWPVGRFISLEFRTSWR